MSGLEMVNWEVSRGKQPLVSIVLAPQNGMDHLPACLESVYAQDYEDFEVIYVDNASTDGSPDYVEHGYPQVKVVRSSRNLAYAGGNNLGAQYAHGELLLFLNHDTVVTEHFLSNLVQAMHQHPDVGIAQSKIMMASAPSLIDSTGAYLTWTGIWVHPNHGYPDHDLGEQPIEILGACGACLMVRRELFRRLGGFDRDFAIYFEDADLSWRSWLLGMRVALAPSSVIYHWGAVTTSRLPSTFTVFHSFKNRLCSLIKLLDGLQLLWVIPIHLVMCLAGGLAYLVKGKPMNAIAILRAICWNVTNLRATLRKRRLVRSMSPQGTSLSGKGLFRPLPARYFLRTSVGYLSRW